MADAFFIGEAYKYIYITICFVLLCCKTFASSQAQFIAIGRGAVSYRKTFALGILFILFFGLRPTQGIAMADTEGYASVYDLTRMGLQQIHEKEFVWAFIQDTMAHANLSVGLWFTVIAAIYILFNIKGIRRLFPNQEYSVFLIYVAFFLFYSGGINGIRNACGCSIVFYAMSLYTEPTKKNLLKIIFWCIIGYQMHSSVIVTIYSFIIACFFIKRTKTAVLVWLWTICIVITLVAGNTLAELGATFIDDDRAISYLSAGKDLQNMEGFSHSGFRWDFLAFSALPIIVGYYVTVTRGVHDRIYQILLNTYIIANAVWIIFIYAQFSNRFAMLSWCIYPYVLIYPYMKFHLWNFNIQNSRALAMLWIMFIFTGYMTFK